MDIQVCRVLPRFIGDIQELFPGSPGSVVNHHFDAAHFEKPLLHEGLDLAFTSYTAKGGVTTLTLGLEWGTSCAVPFRYAWSGG